jgi:hypothetical protein
VEELVRYGGRVPDAVLAHRGRVPDDMALRYRAEEAHPVEVDEPLLQRLGVRSVKHAAIMSRTSKARHDPERTALALRDLFSELIPDAPP